MSDKVVVDMEKNEDGQWSTYTKYFNPEDFWDKIKEYAKIVGCEGIRTSLRLFYALDNPDMPKHIKGIIWGALGYFILPIDIIPDFIPMVGYTDDIGILAAAVGMASLYITADVKEKADEKLRDWFGTGAC